MASPRVRVCAGAVEADDATYLTARRFSRLNSPPTGGRVDVRRGPLSHVCSRSSGRVLVRVVSRSHQATARLSVIGEMEIVDWLGVWTWEPGGSRK
jgi:hypothetical protein